MSWRKKYRRCYTSRLANNLIAFGLLEREPGSSLSALHGAIFPASINACQPVQFHTLHRTRVSLSCSRTAYTTFTVIFAAKWLSRDVQ
jgi:hypothetical protein